LDEPFRTNFSRQDVDRYSYWKRMEFSREQWAGLAEHAHAKQLEFMSSPFSREAVDLLGGIGVRVWKIGSGEALSSQLLEAVVCAGGPLLLSTGMSRWEELDRLTRSLEARHSEFALLQCTSKYPTPLAEVGLNVMSEMRKRYQCPVGLSDHSGTPFPALAAIAQGCDVLELHVVFDRRMFGPDVCASITFDEFDFIRKARDCFTEMTDNPVDKDLMAEVMWEMRATFGKSVALVRSLPAGTVLERNMLTTKKPATGIPAVVLDELVGRRLIRDVADNRLISWEDLQE
jgi:N,N'-diacetyllegionaminate synthase